MYPLRIGGLLYLPAPFAELHDQEQNLQLVHAKEKAHSRFVSMGSLLLDWGVETYPPLMSRDSVL